MLTVHSIKVHAGYYGTTFSEPLVQINNAVLTRSSMSLDTPPLSVTFHQMGRVPYRDQKQDNACHHRI